MSSAVWLLLLIAVGTVIYAWRLHNQLQHYQLKIRQLKKNCNALASNVADGERMDALLVSMNEAVLRLDASGRVVGANRCAKEVFLMQGMELPVSLRQIYRDADWHDALQIALEALPEYTRLPDINLSKIVVSPRLAVLNADHRLLLCVDVTEQCRLELQRRTFLSNLMHDLKTPLTSLLGYARSLERFGEDADFRKEAGAVIADEAKHVNHLLDALLTLDQVEFSAVDVEACCDVIAVIRQVCEILKPQCSDKQLSLAVDTDGTSLLLAVGADDVERMVSNVLVNAINHSPEQDSIRIMVERVEQRCHIIIQDEGMGVPEQDLSRVTERFYRVDKARTRKDGGHGLGLAIVKDLVEKNAGSLILSNRASGGLQVEISLPLFVDSKA